MLLSVEPNFRSMCRSIVGFDLGVFDDNTDLPKAAGERAVSQNTRQGPGL